MNTSQHFLYVFRTAPRICKIGVTSDVSKRLYKLRTDNPQQVVVECVLRLDNEAMAL